MKYLVTSLLLSIGGLTLAQTKVDPKVINFSKVDASPLDVVYYPLAAAKMMEKKASDPTIRVLYSRPQSKGRSIFGNLVKYNDVWRFGANESAEIKFYKPVTIDGKAIPAGAYSIFAIPSENEWTIILNKVTDIWGAYSYDSTKDVIRVKVPVTKLTTPVENFSVTFVQKEKGADLVTAWDNVQVSLPITF